MKLASIRPWVSRKYLARIGSVNIGTAIIATLLMAYFGRIPTGGDFLRILLTCVLFAFSIGSLAAIGLPWILESLHLRSLRAKLAIVAVSVAIITVFGCILALTLMVGIGSEPPESFWRDLLSTVRFSVIIAMAAGIGMFLYETLRDRLEEATVALRNKQLAEERARKLAVEARLSSLESRIHPHFLFNTLNSISALIQEDPRRAEDIVGKLAALLRFSLDAHARSVVPLGQELKIIRDYLEIEKARFGARLRYSIDVPAGLDAIEVPPLALDSLVENAVKHAVSPLREGGEIVISARAEGGRVELAVADSGPGFRLDAIPPGHGIDNLIARLEALFGDAARLEVSAEGGRSVVRVTLPAAQAHAV